MKLSQFPEYLGWMSRACQALVQAKKANDQNNVPAYREELENALKYQKLAKDVDEGAPRPNPSAENELPTSRREDHLP